MTSFSSSQRFLGNTGVWEPCSRILRCTSAVQSSCIKTPEAAGYRAGCGKGSAAAVQSSAQHPRLSAFSTEPQGTPGHSACKRGRKIHWGLWQIQIFSAEGLVEKVLPGPSVGWGDTAPCPGTSAAEAAAPALDCGRQPNVPVVFPVRKAQIDSRLPVLSFSCGSWSACAYTPIRIRDLTLVTCTK